MTFYDLFFVLYHLLQSSCYFEWVLDQNQGKLFFCNRIINKSLSFQFTISVGKIGKYNQSGWWSDKSFGIKGLERVPKTTYYIVVSMVDGLDSYLKVSVLALNKILIQSIGWSRILFQDEFTNLNSSKVFLSKNWNIFSDICCNPGFSIKDSSIIPKEFLVECLNLLAIGWYPASLNIFLFPISDHYYFV